MPKVNLKIIYYKYMDIQGRAQIPITPLPTSLSARCNNFYMGNL